ncbi:unnamed protein product [Caenorhabditis bovis]|uniref:G-protein coupled receptors family 1 profile domain-containing protein n=1 Tax=Caenorhabditis bovis TaxID=2654633 RepID=A0A8S1E9N2_9PELO|nr:unnamed protein product [Caenorhabditis bovis]
MIYDYRDPLTATTAALIFITSIFGIFCNVLVIYSFFKVKKERTSFNLICSFRAYINIHILSTTFLCVFFTVSITGTSIYNPTVESMIIVITNTLYVANQHLSALAVLTFLFLYRIIKVLFEELPGIVECPILYMTQFLTWMPTCSFPGGDELVDFLLLTFIAVAVLNILIFFRILMFYMSDKKNGNGGNEVANRNRMRKNVILFFQTILQDCILLIDGTFTYKLSPLSNTRLWSFICGTYVWECAHTIDGLIMILFNERFALLKKHLWIPSQSQISINIRSSRHSRFQSTNTCHLLYSSNFLTWMPTCKYVDGDILVYFLLIMFIAVVALNILIFAKIFVFYMKNLKSESTRSDEATKQRMRKNVILFFQTILQDCLLLIDGVFTFKLRLIMLLFNERVALLKTHLLVQPNARNSIIISIFGIICNLPVIYVFVRVKNERNSFNLICLVRAYNNIHILLTVFLLIFFPITLLGYSPFNPILETAIITMTNSLYVANQHLSAVVSVNRFVSLFLPLYYNKFFGLTLTTIVTTSILIYRIVAVTIEQVPVIETCHVLYKPEYLSWRPTCDYVDGDEMINFMFLTFIGVAVLNSLIFVKIIFFYVNDARNGSAETRARMRNNGILFFQTVLQDCLLLIDSIFTFKLSSMSDSRIWTFISGTFVWECAHSFDGFIMILFNERFALIKKHLFGRKLIRRSISVRSSLPTLFTNDSDDVEKPIFEHGKKQFPPTENKNVTEILKKFFEDLKIASKKIAIKEKTDDDKSIGRPDSASSSESESGESSESSEDDFKKKVDFKPLRIEEFETEQPQPVFKFSAPLKPLDYFVPEKITYDEFDAPKNQFDEPPRAQFNDFEEPRYQHPREPIMAYDEPKPMTFETKPKIDDDLMVDEALSQMYLDKFDDDDDVERSNQVEHNNIQPKNSHNNLKLNMNRVDIMSIIVASEDSKKASKDSEPLFLSNQSVEFNLANLVILTMFVGMLLVGSKALYRKCYPKQSVAPQLPAQAPPAMPPFYTPQSVTVEAIPKKTPQ